MAMCFAGCSMAGPGQLYTNVVQPYSKDFNNTPVGSKHCILQEHNIQEPVSGFDISVEWSVNQIQSAAQAAGIKTITYIDVQTISYVLGIYTRQDLIVYGD
jgi:hypothetical protein